MNIAERICAWWQERGKTWTIAEDFGGDLVVSCPLGQFLVPGWFRYNRFTGVYNTPYKSMWKASAAHDWIWHCLATDGFVLDLEGRVIIRDYIQGDAVFYYLMIEALKHVFVQLWRKANDRMTPQDIRRDLKKAIRNTNRLMRRTMIYHWGVRRFGLWFRERQKEKR